ncbi:MAG: DUF362 domain-containing protein [Sphaerochaeta sp.]|jgi:uncharacterized protein (DUF362 family)/NAD-dependent dihydropyrimidine dehydrogenase PreA subunit|uniref:DUF362 domain-containing protein n=1 Tax=Sphaerochaeta sp. TaxID=1972642 RepID=UPI002FCBB173
MSKVVIQECRKYDLDTMIPQINAAVELLGGWDAFVKPQDKVLLKVNLIGPKTSDSAAVTHAEFVRAVVRILKGKGCTVWIGDSSGGAIAGIAPTKQGLKVSGYLTVAEEEGAEVKNFDREGVVAVQPESRCEETMYIAKPMFDADVVINLPKFKTHSAQIFSGAVKNVFGCIPGLKKAKYHKMAPNPSDFGQIICDIHKATNIRLHIMDGIQAMQGEGPTAGSAYQANKILVSEDPLALDTVAASMVGIAVEDVPILETARTRNLGESKLTQITLAGDYDHVPELARFTLPKRFGETRKRNSKVLVKVIDFFATRPKINLALCRKCNMCVESCPVQAIDKETKQIDYDACIECMCCHELCMHKAVELVNQNKVAGLISGFLRK